MLTLPLLLTVPALAADPFTEIWSLELQRAPASELVAYSTMDDPSVRARAALAMGRTRDEGALEPLSLLLADPSPEVRSAAAFALGLTEGGAAPARLALRHEEDAAVREQLYFALGLQPEVDSIPVLVEGLGRSAGEARGAGVALGKMARLELEGIQDAAVIEALAQQLTRIDPDARRAAAFALGRMAPTELSDAAFDDLAKRADTDRDANVRAFLVRALAPQGDEAVIEAASRDPDVGVRVAAARALPKAGTPEAVTERLLADPNLHVRTATAEALAASEADVIPLLKPLLTASAPSLRAAAVASLAELGHSDHTRDALKPDQPLLVRVAATGALEDEAQLLRLAARGAEPGIRTAAAARVAELAPSAETGRVLIQSPDPAVVGVGLGLLAEHPDAQDLDAVVNLLMPATDMDVLREGLGALEAIVPLSREIPGSADGVVARAQASPSLSVREAAQPVAALLELPEVATWAQPVPDLEAVQQIQVARILTDQGELRVRLRPDVAPYTVHNFAKLAESDFFDGSAFHRVVPDFVIQDGCPRGDGWGGPEWSIPDELSPLPYDEGVLGMALSGPDTGGSQWFLTLSPQPHLDAAYTVFGELILGPMQAIHAGAVIQDVVIERVP